MKTSEKNRVAVALMRLIIIAAASHLLTSCYFFDFFKKKGGGSSGSEEGGVLGQSLGNKAGSQNDAGLAALYAVTTTIAPAPIRPDPDVMVRRLLRQYRDEGATVARQIGRVEDYRLLLGGASQDFATAAQETYDATSVLAFLKVAEEVCTGLVAPNANDHAGWATILPAAATDSETNLRFLAQRFSGLPSNRISNDMISGLRTIMNDASKGAAYELEHYVPACVTIALDASAMYF